MIAMIFFRLASSFLLLGLTQPLAAQGDSTSAGSTFRADLETLWCHTGRFFSSPLRFDGGSWIAAGAVATGTVILFSLDEPARSLAQRNQSSAGNDIFEVGRQYGREVYGLALAGGCYAGGLAFHQGELRKTGMMIFESIAFAGVTTIVLKVAAGRSRPYREAGNLDFHPFSFNDERNSLPSGHSTVAFAVSSVLSSRIGNPVATAGLYSLAALTAASRVYHDEHWLSDTFLGACIGTVSGLAVSRFYDEGEGPLKLSVGQGADGPRLRLVLPL